jgi:dipeptidyl aminopeptidase/acylaminoacyl peptidase
MSFFKRIIFIITLLSTFSAFAQEAIKYQKPSQSIIDLVDAPILPKANFSANGEWMLLLQPQGFLSSETISKTEIQIAGVLIDPIINSTSIDTFYTDIKLKSVKKDEEFTFEGLPDSLMASEIKWAPDESKIAFCNTTANGIELWIADCRTFTSRKISNLYLNKTVGNTFCWQPESDGILAKFITEDRGKIPVINSKITEPVVLENAVKLASIKSFDNLLTSDYDKNQFNYYLLAQLKLVNMEGGASDFYNSGIFKSFDFSPDGKYILLENIKKYTPGVPVNQLAFAAEILTAKGSLVKTIFEAPVADYLITNYDAAPKGPRHIAWRTDKPATLYWIEAQDFGNPNLQVSLRDGIFTLEAPFRANKVKIADCYLRFKSILWKNDDLAIVTERWWKTRSERRVYIKPADQTFRINLVDRYFDDTYSDPGTLVTTKNEYNRSVLLADDSNIFYIGDGGTTDGDQPYLMKFNINTKITDTLFRSKAPFYERPVFFNGNQFLITTKESVDSVPNYYRVKIPGLVYKQLTDFTELYPNFVGINKQRVSYQRPDGVPLNGILYLPANYNASQGTLPLIMWACPKDYKTKAAAGTVKGSISRYPNLDLNSPLYWITKGFAVFDKMEMPVIGESLEEPFDTYQEQLRFNTEPALKKLVELGVADPKRIAITGDEAGAGMTAVLLATTKIFATGLAYNGTYNYTSSPFGFGSDQRTLWQAPEMYNKISAINSADKISVPLLLISSYNTQNLSPAIQAQTFYTSLKANGVSTRLAVLPSSSQNNFGRAATLHLLWEKEVWLNKYLKNK